MKTLLSLAPALALAAICGPGCKSGQLAAQPDYGPATSGKPVVVYVTDFELGAQTIKPEEGLLAESGRLHNLTGGLIGKSADPAVRAQDIVNLMSDTLVKHLTHAGFAASRVPAGMPLPAQGWLVRGLFTEVAEGNRLRRAVIGFGQGQTDIQVVTRIDDLSQGVPKPLYEIAAGAASGSKPGAAPTLVLGPYGAAARYVMAGQDLEKNVKQTAAKIAEQMASHIRPLTPNL